ncbi:phosphoadenosine phosphosulfate reductase family protein [Klebsiella pneumoniae]
MSVTHVVSFSGGRTSAYLVHLMEQRRKDGEDVRYVFMDTGAEHPGTYKFIREVVSNWGIDLICLRVDVNPELGKGNGYKIISIDDIGPDLQPWIDITKKIRHSIFWRRVLHQNNENRSLQSLLQRQLRQSPVMAGYAP